ncbi:PTS sugar transporter subunit IIA [Sulfuriferula sp. AH1]|uniref:PTS sugar transporter subunit IIA n=1 Tax=Sulfuriferula sp. AH1 TaxID=1985873 RepID=UPI000B3B7E21|nr:PTS sugar transporter subunit IIA [Sulfuriferula sp. AH1]ARU32560.1 PTS sugar transporter subunit IIA [Sulfuriferula sp. AH1]
MNQIVPLLPISHILLDIGMGSKKRLFEYVGQLFGSEVGVAPNVILDSLIAREKLGSTGLGQGIAIPHGRIKGLKSATGVLVRLEPAIDFDAPDHLPVKLVFMLFVPMQATDLHLQILGELAQLFSNKALRDALLTSTDSEGVLDLIRNWQP